MSGEAIIMWCRVCGGGLPAGAVFCGDCGTAARHPGWADASLDRSRPRAGTRADARAYERVPAAGRSVSAGLPDAALERSRPVPAPESETTVRTGNGPAPVRGPVPALDPRPRTGARAPEVGPDLWFGAEPEPEPEPAWLSEPDPERPGREGEPGGGSSAASATATAPMPAVAPALPGAPATGTATAEAPAPAPADAPAAPPVPTDDSGEETFARTAARPTGPALRQPVCGSVIARFSTGETVTLHGTGLIGRNPQPQEGERFDAIVRIHDPARSVSKTHLEFVVDAGRLWIRDRYSGNGTVLRHPNGTGSRCEAGRRYRVQEGDRVEIGEQFFDLR